MTDEEFWNLGVDELNVLLERYQSEEETLDRRVATICMVLANCHRDPKKKAYTIADFVPKKAKEKAVPVQKQTPDQLLSMFRVWNAAIGGKEKLHGNQFG